MNNKEKFLYTVTLILGVVLGALLGTADNRNLTDACEAELPRNQHCEIIAVPKDD